MPKPRSLDALRRYPGLADIPADEWDDYFGRTGKAWEQDEDEYLREWYGREPLVDLAYALERTPWTVMERAHVLVGKIGRGGQKRVI